MRIREYTPADLPEIQRIHAESGIDYTLPNLSSPLFLVTRVLEDDDGTIRAAGGMYIQVECYLWLDGSNWTDPGGKLDAIIALDRECTHAAWLQGIECAVLWLPPGMDRFGDRLVKELGFTKDRDGWCTYSKVLKG